MAVLEFVSHVLNFFAPALGVGVLASAGAKLLWRRELQDSSWLRLAAWSGGAGALVLAGDLLLSGHDGRIAAYAAMLLASALALLWVGARR